VDIPFVYTLHHPHGEAISEYYSYYSDVQYVAISDFQRQQERMPRLSTIRHGIDISRYSLGQNKRQYLTFLGRISPAKGSHLAIAVAKQAGIPLRIAGDVLPVYRDYFDAKIKPHLDGHFVEFVGHVDLAGKNELLANSLALLFPIQWHEPFGLVMIEAMACGTPVLALAGGSVQEIVRDGVTGYVCNSVQELVNRVGCIEILVHPNDIRRYAEQNFSIERMASEYDYLYRSL
jgi:glycosyltransferase involved in cell wall biosynthesis